jgi:hypothetical protein
MSTTALKRELALLRSSLAALTPSQSTTLDDPVAWAERIAGLTLDPWQRDVLLSVSPRLLLNATRQSGKSTAAALKAARTVLEGGLAVVVSPSLRQSGFLFRKLTRHLIASEAAFQRETLTEVELVTGGLAVSLPGDRPAMLRGLSLRHDGPAVLIVDEASRVQARMGRARFCGLVAPEGMAPNAMKRAGSSHRDNQQAGGKCRLKRAAQHQPSFSAFRLSTSIARRLFLRSGRVGNKRSLVRCATRTLRIASGRVGFGSG